MCLHGYRQNEKVFREKTGSFRKALKKYADFVFMSAPHEPVLPPQPCSQNDGGGECEKIDEQRADPRGWWFSRSENHFSSHDVTDLCTGFDESVKAVLDFAAKEACFAFVFSLVLSC
ncbi:unnamed protein product [Anisakis simplex]|uniref:Serine hydrolase domain-containing protein n=1 Tax=Anisakis simplex TaxID=6269 RepID=A0A3P6TX97_ANISI|nr:unnamed protein product [Anisakis simplex]